MDSGTHFVVGLGLGGLALIDPAIAAHPFGPIAVMIGTIAGSNAPDADTLLKLKNNAEYIRHHRGLSHSIPAMAGWIVLITGILAWAFQGIPWLHIGVWVGLAVVLHVLSDLFNAHGTQVLLPVSKRRVAWNIIHIFDPFIFASHLVAIALWIAGAAEPAVIFPALYGVLVLYYCWRTNTHHVISRKISSTAADSTRPERWIVLPTMSLYRWNVIKAEPDGLYNIGEWNHGRLVWLDQVKCASHPAIEASKQHPDVQALLQMTDFPCGEVHAKTWGYEVRWIDLRFRYRRQYPFVAVVLMDTSLNPLQSYVGWLSDKRLQKRLGIQSY